MINSAAIAFAFTPRKHGSNTFSSGLSVTDALTALGLAPCHGLGEAEQAMRRRGFAYLPLSALSPRLDRLLGMRRLFGLRSPVNTVARLLDPANAPAGVDGVFHPAYIAVHLGVAERMRRGRRLVLKGGGGEAERNPAKPMTAHVWSGSAAAVELSLPTTLVPGPSAKDDDQRALLAPLWQGEAAPARPLAVVIATIALALLATGRETNPLAADDAAQSIWAGRFGSPKRS